MLKVFKGFLKVFLVVSNRVSRVLVGSKAPCVFCSFNYFLKLERPTSSPWPIQNKGIKQKLLRKTSRPSSGPPSAGIGTTTPMSPLEERHPWDLERRCEDQSAGRKWTRVATCPRALNTF